MLESLVIEPEKAARYAVIWLHGLGADGHDFAPIVPELHLSETQHIRFIFPHAPLRPVTVNMGCQMHAWYDIKRLDEMKRDVDTKGIEQAISEVSAIIESQVADGIDSRNIILAGFSQGGAVAALSALSLKHQLAGVVLLSTYLPDWDYFKQHLSDENLTTDFLVVHGSADNVVPIKAGALLSQTLTQLKIPVAFHSYPMAHQLCAEAITLIAAFINQHLTDSRFHEQR